MMHKENNTNSEDNFAELNKIIDDAATATDVGDYENALIGFKQAVEEAERFFGNNTELIELMEQIDEVNSLLANSVDNK